MKRNFALIAPYAAWMVLMTILPSTAWAYAVRGAATAVLLLVGAFLSHDQAWATRRSAPTVVWGLLVGVIVFAVWIAPEPWLWPGDSPSQQLTANSESPFAPENCGWALTIAKLFASAFVISVAEELFFRKWLVEFAGFGWMLVLFGVEHMRWDLGMGRGCVFIAEGVFAGLAYGLLARRFGILSAVVAHAVTNLVLGFYVIGWDKWFYW